VTSVGVVVAFTGCAEPRLSDLEVFYLGHLKNFYTIQYNCLLCNLELLLCVNAFIRPTVNVLHGCVLLALQNSPGSSTYR